MDVKPAFLWEPKEGLGDSQYEAFGRGREPPLRLRGGRLRNGID